MSSRIVHVVKIGAFFMSLGILHDRVADIEILHGGRVAPLTYLEFAKAASLASSTAACTTKNVNRRVRQGLQVKGSYQKRAESS